jgi:hypothetical protein
MHCFIIAALLLSLTPPADPSRPIHIVYIEPPGAVWTADERAEARAGVQAALDFWPSTSLSQYSLECITSLSTCSGCCSRRCEV